MRVIKIDNNDLNADWLESFRLDEESKIHKSRIYLKPGENPPKGIEVKRGPKGGLYYDDKVHIKKPSKEKAPPRKTHAKNIMENYMKNLNATSEGKEQLDHIRDYSAGGYKVMNDFLRTKKLQTRDPFGKPVAASKKQKQAMTESCEKVSNFLHRAPKTEARVYRGMRFDKDTKGTKQYNTFLANVSEGGEITFPSFSSTTISKSTGEGFGGKRLPDKFKGILIEMTTKNGVYLNGASEFEDEDEILFDKEANFIVEKVDRGDNFTTIQLREK